MSINPLIATLILLAISLILFVGVIPTGYIFYKKFSTSSKKKFFGLTFLGIVFFTLALFFSMQIVPEITRMLYFFLGVVSFAFFFGIGFWITYGFLRIFQLQKILFSRSFLAVFFLSLGGIMSFSIFQFFQPIHIERYTITSEKITKPYTLVQSFCLVPHSGGQDFC